MGFILLQPRGPDVPQAAPAGPPPSLLPRVLRGARPRFPFRCRVLVSVVGPDWALSVHVLGIRVVQRGVLLASMVKGLFSQRTLKRL